MKYSKAFTIIELVFVIVIVSILSYTAIASFNTSTKLTEASNKILGAIKYTQHLAMQDNRFNPSDPLWFQERWTIRFFDCNDMGSVVNDLDYYVIYSDTNGGGNANRDESAIDPLNGKRLFSGGNCDNINDLDSPSVLVGNNFGIESVNLSCTGTDSMIFDNLGRLHTDNNLSYGSLVHDDCDVTFTTNRTDNNFTITINGETGYSYVSSINQD